jgi:hypothetical protein
MQEACRQACPLQSVSMIKLLAINLWNDAQVKVCVPLVLSQSKSQQQSGVCPWLSRWVYPDTQARLTRYPQILRSRPRVPTHVPGLAADWDESRKVPADRDTR